MQLSFPLAISKFISTYSYSEVQFGHLSLHRYLGEAERHSFVAGGAATTGSLAFWRAFIWAIGAQRRKTPRRR